MDISGKMISRLKNRWRTFCMWSWNWKWK